MNLFRFSRFAIAILIIAMVATLVAAEPVSPKPLAADKATDYSKLVIKLQGKQLEYFGAKDQIDAQRKQFEKQAEEALQKKVSEFQTVQAEYQKFVEEQRKLSGAAADCNLNESGKWKCPDPPAKK